ncbi:MAG: hypothetical protein KGK14_10145 [Bacteroidota bacterium]|nr:hypothetical protein [Bacteroidota bacterium]
MRYICVIIFLLSTHLAKSQFYYNDIIAANQSQKNYLQLKAQKIKSLDVASFDEQNEPVNNFSLQQSFSNNWNKMIINSKDAKGEKSILITTYKNNLVMNTFERTNQIETITNYTYDTNKHVILIETITKDSVYKYQNTEKHIWNYSLNGRPINMLKIKNNKDTTVVHFTFDEHGNVAEEKWIRFGNLIETYYYYYDEANLLTDIVRYNRNVKKLLPDYLFEYNPQQQLISMTQVSPNSNSYLVWHYSYNADGLKEEDVCRNKENQLVAKFKYIYHR